MLRRLRTILCFLPLLVLAGCHTTKFVPEGRYLLNKAKIEVTDTKQVSSGDLRGYLRQKPNTEILGFWKLQLDIYNTAPSDTTTKTKKRLARNAHRLGEAPEIYDDALTRASMEQLTKAMHNKGYFHSTVDTVLKVKKRKMNIIYRVTAREPYRLRNVSYLLPYAELREVASDARRTLLKEGMLFDADVLDEERQRIVSVMRRRGYYYMEKDMLRYVADSALQNREVDVELRLQDYIEQMSDSDQARLFRKYKVRRVCFHMDYDPAFVPDSMAVHHTESDEYQTTWVGRRLLRERSLKQNCAIRPGEFFNERRVELTYEMLNRLGIVKYVDISFDAVGRDELDCHIVMSRSKLNTFSAEIEGTYSSGDWGVSAGVGYINRNIFHGAEELQLGASGGYEWRQNGGRAVEAKLSASLAFPNRLKLSLNGQYQTRPDEFTRAVANAGLGYTLRSTRPGWSHYFSFLEVSYVYVPWMSDEFRDRFINNSNPLKYSYESHLIDALSYTALYSGYRRRSPNRSYSQARFFAEAAGNVLYGIMRGVGKPDDDGVYKIGSVPFAQYVKADASYTYNCVMAERHRLVWHAGVGVAVPFCNSSSVPYEKRYFAGGSNHVRGWTARSLGPGAYRGEGTRIDYDNQTGDIHLDLSMEYRWKVWSFIELAAFTDAGNVWTIRDYSTQPHGVFRWNEFYKQLAWSYGVGLRLDFSILVFRVDFGVKLYDPSRIYYDQKQWRTAGNGLGWSDDMTFHFAIGYPF